MKSLLNPKWIFVVNTLPILILFFIGWGELSVIKSLLSESNLEAWEWSFLPLLLLMVCSFMYALIKTVRKQPTDIVYHAVSFIVYIVYLYYFYMNHASDLIPFSIPRWMVSGNLIFYVGSFVMPSLIFSLFALVVMFTPRAKEFTTWISLMWAILIPVLFYGFGILASPLWRKIEIVHSEYLVVALIIMVTTIFLFFFIRFVYIFFSKRDSQFGYENHFFLKFIIAFMLPLTGLIINLSFDDVFGDFSSPWFFVVAALSGVFICLPDRVNKKYRLIRFIGRCFALSYSLYFFLVFLPFLPFSIFAIVLLGVGFLMLTPLALFVICVNDIAKDYTYVKRYYKQGRTVAVGVISFLILPALITAGYSYDRMMLHRTLDYIYSTDYSQDSDIDGKAVLSSLKVIEERSKFKSFFYESTPFLSSYYKWLVFDNLNISTEKRQLIKDIFGGKDIDDFDVSVNNDSAFQSDTTNISLKPSISIVGISHKSEYDPKKKTWLSWVDLQIKNNGVHRWNSVYQTQFELPTGCWISDYYLYVDDVKEMGILAEKKAATWIFNQIRNENKDPGLLKYLSGNTIQFKVFPFEPEELRLTGIQFIHKEPVEINIDGYTVRLGEKIDFDRQSVITDQYSYVSAEDKQHLNAVKRKPYYHFIVDGSGREDNDISKSINDIKTLLSRGFADAGNAKISFVSSKVTTFDMQSDWEDKLKGLPREGGFFLDRAVRKTLYDSYINVTDTYPMMFVVSDDINRAVVLNGFSDMEFAYPDNSYLYWMNNNVLKPCRLSDFAIGNPIAKDATLETKSVRIWYVGKRMHTYLADNAKPSIVLSTHDKQLTIDANLYDEKSWDMGLAMQVQWMMQTLYPQTADRQWLPLVFNSFRSKIMTPLTSYIVVENEAQKEMLKKKQNDVLSGHRSLDLSEDTVSMSEPDFYLLLVILLFLFFARNLYRKKMKVK